jgi:hypothetical protein
MREIFIGKGLKDWRAIQRRLPRGWTVEQFWVPSLRGTDSSELDWYAVGPDGPDDGSDRLAEAIDVERELARRGDR